jgi:gamma-glutamylcyclotransferase (GGCT)/AIG2-like uncharacterized protein YtfP
MREFLLFVCGALMFDEPAYGRLGGARMLGAVQTVPKFELVDLGNDAGMIEGASAVSGELYTVNVTTLAALDVQHGHPVLHRRVTIELDGGIQAEAYLLHADQVRGRRRIRSGDWRKRPGILGAITPPRPQYGGALVEWTRNRWRTK